MAYVDQAALAKDSAFEERVRVAMLTAAIAVANESNATTNHTNRAKYSTLVLSNPEQYASQFSEAVATNATINISSLDSDILFTVNSMWNAMAGVI